MKDIYVVIGEREEMAQSRIGGDFEATYYKEAVNAFEDIEKAEEWIKDQRLAAPKKERWSGTKYYKGGYYDLQIEKITLR